MSVRMAGPVSVERLEERRLLAGVTEAVPGGVAEAVAWDLQTPISGEIVGDPDYYKFTATSGEKIVFDSSGMKSIAIVDSDGRMQLDHLFIFDGSVNPTPGRLVWEAPHLGTFYITVGHYRGFLIDSPKGPYSLAAYPVHEEVGPQIAAGQTIDGDFSSAGD